VYFLLTVASALAVSSPRPRVGALIKQNGLSERLPSPALEHNTAFRFPRTPEIASFLII
jgi:hypothetical protein